MLQELFSRKFGFLLLMLALPAMLQSQTIALSDDPVFLLRGTTCGATTSFPSFTASASGFGSDGSRLFVPESLLADHLGDVTAMQAANASIPSDASNVLFKVGAQLQQDADANPSALNIKINVPGSGERNFIDSDDAVVNYLRQKWFVDQQLWNISDPDQQTQRVKDAIQYLRGKHNLEQAPIDPICVQFPNTPICIDLLSRPFRSRKYTLAGGTRVDWMLGEVFGKPLLVGAPRMHYSEFGYAQFAQTNAARATVLFFAAGDGMIHGIYYDGPDTSLKGHQIYAFIPSAVAPQLGEYTKPDYQRKSFVNGTLQAFDVYNGSQWKTFLVATLNRGGKSIVVIDITDPLNPVFRFEFTNAELGYSYSPVALGRFADSTAPGKKFYFLTGSGFQNANQRAYVIAFDVNGNLMRSVQIPNDVDQPSAENGSMSITVFDKNSDGITDSIYAGTYQGQLYRIDTPSADPLSWQTPVLVADFSPLSITASPVVMQTEDTRSIIVGTGKLLSSSDLTDAAQQYFTRFEDNGVAVTLANLDQYDATFANGPNGKRFIQVSAHQNVANEKGYAIKLPERHKFLTPALLLADGLLFTTLDPDIQTPNLCTDTSGRSALWYLPAGKMPYFAASPNIDVDGDGAIDADDVINGKAPAGIETPGSTFAFIPQASFNQYSLKIYNVQFYSSQVSNGLQHAKLGAIHVRNRFKAQFGQWKESATVK